MEKYGLKKYWWLLIVAILFSGISYYAYREHQRASYLELRTENMYQQAFHSLVAHIDDLELQLSRALATSDQQQQMQLLSEIWRKVYAAQEEIGKLPLAFVPLSNTEKFLSKVSDFTYNIAKETVNGYLLNDSEWKTLAELKRCSVEMALDMRKLQERVLVNNLRFVEVELATNKDTVQDNSVVNNLELFDEKVQEYSEVDIGTRVNVIKPPAYGPKGNEISTQQAEAIALDYVGKAGVESNIEVVKTGESNGHIPAWTISIKNQEKGFIYTYNVSKRGGQVLWFMADKPLDKPQINLNKAQELAEEYLNSIGQDSMQLVGFEEYQGEGVFNYAFNNAGAIVYPDLVKVRVALDDGNISGYEATEYVKYHHQRQIPDPELTQLEAQDHLRKDLEVLNSRRAIIFNSSGKETLTYEFSATGANENYLIYIDANSGDEVQILRIDDSMISKPAFMISK